MIPEVCADAGCYLRGNSIYRQSACAVHTGTILTRTGFACTQQILRKLSTTPDSLLQGSGSVFLRLIFPMTTCPNIPTIVLRAIFANKERKNALSADNVHSLGLGILVSKKSFLFSTKKKKIF